jgi:DNA helicase HerA-like ATPase
VGKLLMAAFSRIDTPENERKDFNLYIDEFQNFTTDSISTILSEARKYRLNLVIAHQFIAQLQEKIRDSVFGNVGSMVVFRIGADDAQYLVKQFEPVFSERDLISIDNLNAYVKLLVRGQTTVPFNIHTLLYPKMDMAYGEKVKELAMLKYGADRAAVEADILRRLRS